MSVDLIVPFADKNKVKRLGAYWDAERKIWFIPDHLDTGAFRQWVAEKRLSNIWSKPYFIAKTHKQCWKCRAQTPIIGVLLPQGHQIIEPSDTEEDQDEIFRYFVASFVSYIYDLAPSVAARMSAESSLYRYDFGTNESGYYWMNHCANCDRKQQDQAIYHQRDGAFYSIPVRSSQTITLIKVDDLFSCNGVTDYRESEQSPMTLEV